MGYAILIFTGGGGRGGGACHGKACHTDPNNK